MALTYINVSGVLLTNQLNILSCPLISFIPRFFMYTSVWIGFPNVMVFYIAPSLCIILTTVLKIILKSFLTLHSLIYWVSSFTTSSKSVILLLPLICLSFCTFFPNSPCGIFYFPLYLLRGRYLCPPPNYFSLFCFIRLFVSFSVSNQVFSVIYFHSFLILCQ